MSKSTTEAEKPKRKSSDKIKEELGKPFERPLMDDPDKPNVTTDDVNQDNPGHTAPLPFEHEKGADVFHPPFKNPKIEIVKGKLLKEKIIIEYTKQDSLEEKPAHCTYEHTAPPRKQLRNAFASLAIHCALLGEFITLTAVDEILEPDPELTKDFNVSGFTLVAPGDDDEGVILTAQKTLKSGKILGFNTPIIRFGDESENSYPYLDDLSEDIDLCKREMKLYLEGTHEVDPQGKLFD